MSRNTMCASCPSTPTPLQFQDAGLPPHAGITIGCDYAPPTNQSALFSAWAAADAAAGGGVLPTIEYSHFHEWLDALSDGPTGLTGVPTVTGERPNIWIYECTPTHHWLFSSFRDAGRLLPAAEAFAAFFSLVSHDHFASYPAATLDTAWLNLTLDDHGIAPEVVPKGQGLPDWFINDNSPDHWDEVWGLLSRVRATTQQKHCVPFPPLPPTQVYADKYARARDAGAALLASAQASLAALVNTTMAPQSAVATVVVFNSLSWARDDPVFGVMPPAGGKAGMNATYAVVDSTGAPVPSQPSTNGSILFVASEVPSLGYATYYVVPSTADAAGGDAPRGRYPAPGTPWDAPFTNAFYTVAPGRGGVASWTDLATGAELFDTRFYDVGEWMELQVCAV